MRSNAKQVMQRLMNKFEHVKREAPAILANTGQKFFNDAFRAKRWGGAAWPEVERRKPGTGAYKYPKKKYLARRTNPILVGKTRRLKNALNRSVKRHNVNRIVWGVYGIPYAEAHNKGLGQKTRTFMGASKGFGKALKAKFEQIYRKRLR